MEMIPQIFTAKVMHKRHFPKVNQFTYGVYYLALPLHRLSDPQITDHLKINRPGLLSFCEKDHGAKDGSALEDWVRNTLSEYGLNETVKHITLISMPRVLGYVFNPVSFWMCFDQEKQLRAVLCEVNNTFGEKHSYLCVHDDHRIIGNDDWLTADKLFHVSPFMKREGLYHFRFAPKGEKLGIWIDYYDEHGNKQLSTALTGALQPLTKSTLRHAFWKHPLVTIKTIILIHWQAVKLCLKGIKYITKPTQKDKKLSSTHNLTKM